jgi:predicted RNA-binding Zn ribbon-like protein
MTDTNISKPAFKFLGGWLCLDFVNTRNWDSKDPVHERFKAYSDFVWWNRQADTFSHSETQHLLQQGECQPAEATAAFEQGLALRDVIYHIFRAIEAGLTPDRTDLSVFNAALSEALAHLRVVWAEDNFIWAWSNQENMLEQAFWPVLRSAADLLTSDKLDRLGKCAGDSCGWLFLDLSRNRSRRWCDMTHCGNRAKARRHYKRRHSTGTQK